MFRKEILVLSWGQKNIGLMHIISKFFKTEEPLPFTATCDERKDKKAKIIY